MTASTTTATTNPATAGGPLDSSKPEIADDPYQLFPYQAVGADYLATHAQALLADEQGLGKSAQVVRACDLVHAKRILVVCPGVARVNWSREFARFSPFDHVCQVILTGKDSVRSTGPIVVIISFDLVAAHAKTLLASEPFDVLVIDEAHYLKERSTKRTKLIYGATGVAKSCSRVWRLTGTPAPNDFSELYTHLKSAGIVTDSYWDFVFRYCTGFNAGFGFKITGSKNVEELKALLARFMLRRKKKDVMTQLPPLTFQEVVVDKSMVDLDPYFLDQTRGKSTAEFFETLKVADQTLRNALKAVANSGARVDVLSALNGGSMITLRRFIGLAKLPAVLEIIGEELKSGVIDKIVLFAVHKDVIEGARVALAKFGPVTLYGGTPQEKRQANIDRFQTDPKCRVFIGNVEAAGTAITLTKAHEVGFLEMDWTPARNAQAAMRCHRIGQENPVRVRAFSLAGSVDEDVMKTLLRKTKELAKIF